MSKLSNLEKITESRKRVGRGGHRGKYCGRGRAGQRARSGGKTELKAFFEGGQMPLVRRLPCRGFTNSFRKERKIINLSQLDLMFNDGETVNKQTLMEKGIIKGKGDYLIKVLGTGAITKKLVVNVDAVSASAVSAIQSVGGSLQKV